MPSNKLSFSTNQKGAAHLFLLLVGLAVIVYLLVAGLAPLKDRLFSFLYGKPDSQASEVVDAEAFRLQNPKSSLERYLNPFGESWKNKRFKNPDIPYMITAFFDRTCGGARARCEKKPDGSWRYPSWNSQLQYNRFLPDYGIPTGVLPDPTRTYTLDLRDGYENLIKNASADLHVIGAGGMGLRSSFKLQNEMRAYKIVVDEIKKLNPSIKSYGYYTFSFVEEPGMVGYPEYKKYPNGDPIAGDLLNPAHEEWFIHRKGTGTCNFYQGRCPRREYRPEDRLLTEHSQPFIDVTNPALQEYMAEGIAKSMRDNNIDMLLVDNSGMTGYLVPLKSVQHPDGVMRPESPTVFPDHYNLQSFFNGNIEIFRKVKQKIGPNKQVYFNPIQPDAFDDTRVAKVKELLVVTDGSYWEDPFTLVKRDILTQEGGPDHYYNMLQKFFDAFKETNKKLIVETNTVNQLDLSSLLNFSTDPTGKRYFCEPLFYCAYQTALQQVGYNAWLKEEQRIARLNLGMYLLFMDPQYTYYKHHTLMEEVSYEWSEDFWADYDLKIGRPVTAKEKAADHVYRRVFDKAQVWVNYSNKPYTLPAGALPCNTYQGVCHTPHYVTAEGEPVTAYTLQPFSAMIFVLPSVLEPYNPSFETPWNWKPNGAHWGELDESIFHSGRRAHKIPHGLSGSPGLIQKYQFLPNTTYTWSAWVKTQDNRNPQTIAVSVPGGVTSSNGQVTEGRFVLGNVIPTGTHDWRKIELTFTTQQGGLGNLYSVLQGSSNGTVWFDDVALTVGGGTDSSRSVLPQPTVNIKANNLDGPVTIKSGDAITISFTSNSATACTGSSNPNIWGGNAGLNTTGFGSRPTQNTTYTLTCTGPGGSATDSITVNVAPRVDIRANNSDGPITIARGTAATISFTSSGATQCTASSNPNIWAGNAGLNTTGFGSRPTQNTTYTLTCTGPGGTTSDSVRINVQ